MLGGVIVTVPGPGPGRSCSSACSSRWLGPIFAGVPKRVKGLAGLLAVVLSAGCAPGLQDGVYRGDSKEPLGYALEEARGVRDGDRMQAAVRFRGPGGETLSLDLDLAVGVPTTLRRGSYRRESADGVETGVVRARSVTFLGGQSDWPNLGGSFDLLAEEGMAYHVRFSPVEVRPPG